MADPREPDWALVQKKGRYVTLRLAWEEYLEACPGGYGYLDNSSAKTRGDPVPLLA